MISDCYPFLNTLPPAWLTDAHVERYRAWYRRQKENWLRSGSKESFDAWMYEMMVQQEENMRKRI